MAKVLVVGDIHLPVTHPGYLRFCQDLYYQWDCDKVVFIGDIVDLHAVSFHAANPDCPGPRDEYELAFEQVKKWTKAFPVGDVTIGNHDARPERLAEKVNVPANFIRSHSDLWGTPNWNWVSDLYVDEVYYYHGTGQGGTYPAANACKKMLTSTVIGHNHSAAGIKWFCGPKRRIFGMDVGCGIDDRAMAFAYGRHFKQKSALAAAVVIDGHPYHEMMPCGVKEPYNRSKFK
jgi:predicted phosphodiesterase